MNNILTSRAQLDSLMLEISRFIVNDYMQMKLYKSPKKIFSDKYFETIGIINIYNIEFYLLIDMKEQFWWNIIDEFRGLLYHHSVYQQESEYKTTHINHLKYQFVNYHQNMSNQSLYLENCQIFVNFLAQNCSVFFHCKGCKFPVENMESINLFNSLLKKIGKYHSMNRVDWSYNYFLNECNDNNLLFMKKINKRNFMDQLLPSNVQNEYLKIVKVKKIETYRYHYGIISSRTYKFKIWDPVDETKVAEVLFYYNNTVTYRNAPENKSKSISFLDKLQLFKYRSIFLNYPVSLRDKLKFYKEHSLATEIIIPRVEVRCFDYRCTEDTFLYFDILYKKQDMEITKVPRSHVLKKFNSLVIFLIHSLRNCDELRDCVIYEELLNILFNGFNLNTSFLKTAFVKEVFLGLQSSQIDRVHVNYLCRQSIRSQMSSLGMNFMEKEIEVLMFNLLLIVEDYQLELANSPQNDSSDQNDFQSFTTVDADDSALSSNLENFKKVMQGIIQYVIFYQLVIDILILFGDDTISKRSDWLNMEIGKYQFKLKQKVLMENTVEELIELFQKDLPVQNGTFVFPEFLNGSHTFRQRERNHSTRITVKKWLSNLFIFFNDENNISCCASSRKMFLILQNFCIHYKIDFNFHTLFAKVISKYSMVQLPELGIVTCNSNSNTQFVSKIHTSKNNEIANYWVWVQVKSVEEFIILEEDFSKINLRNQVPTINQFYSRCLEKLPPSVKFYSPSAEIDNKTLFQQLNILWLKSVNQFQSCVSVNRDIYTRNRKNIDKFVESWYDQSVISKNRKLVLLRYFCHSFGIIFYIPQGFLTKTLKKEDFVKEFPFFQPVTKGIICKEIELKSFIC